MKPFMRIAAVLALLPLASLVLMARPTHSESALWIKISKHGTLTTTIAVTEEIARMVATSKKTNVHFNSCGNDRDLITKAMILSVLDGSESSMTAKDPANDTEAEVFMKRLNVPGSRKDKSQLVMETYKEGERSLRVKLGSFSFESGDDETDGSTETEFSWKSLLPFLSETGGGVYIHDHSDDTEVWVFVE